MISGICPKCGSDEVYKSHKISRSLYPGNRIMIKMGMMTNSMAILVHYVCTNCRYIESYIANDDSSMDNIKEDWLPVNEKQKRKNDE